MIRIRSLIFFTLVSMDWSSSANRMSTLKFVDKSDNESELEKRIRKMSYDLETSVKKLRGMIKMFYCLRSKWFKTFNGWNLFWPSKIKDKSFFVSFFDCSPKGIWIPIIKIDIQWIKKVTKDFSKWQNIRE